MATIGVDLEVVLEDKRGVAVPACEILPAQDAVEAEVFAADAGGLKSGNLYNDGMPAEMNLAVPHTCRDTVAYHINHMMKKLDERAKTKGLKAVLKSCGTTELSIKHRNERAYTVGCDPEIDAYTGCMAPPIEGFKDKTEVPAGLHLHCGLLDGYSGAHLEPVVMSLTDSYGVDMLVKAMDVFIGCVMVLFSDDKTRADRIRGGYGMAGRYRIKSYGLEYRSLGSDSARHCAGLSLALGLMKDLIYLINNGHGQEIVDMVKEIGDDRIRYCIEKQSSRTAMFVCKKILALAKNKTEDLGSARPLGFTTWMGERQTLLSHVLNNRKAVNKEMSSVSAGDWGYRDLFGIPRVTGMCSLIKKMAIEGKVKQNGN